MRWQYKTIKLATTGLMGGKLDAGELDRQLNELGRDGWELMTVFDTNQGSGQSRDVVAVLKRQK
jgi:hypothetical protein